MLSEKTGDDHVNGPFRTQPMCHYSIELLFIDTPDSGLMCAPSQRMAHAYSRDCAAAAWSLTISKHSTFPLAPSEFSCCRSRDLRLGVIFQGYADFHESPGKFSRDDNFFHRYWSRRWHGRIIWTTILQRPVLASRRGICPSLPTLPLIKAKSEK